MICCVIITTGCVIPPEIKNEEIADEQIQVTIFIISTLYVYQDDVIVKA